MEQFLQGCIPNWITLSPKKAKLFYQCRRGEVVFWPPLFDYDEICVDSVKIIIGKPVWDKDYDYNLNCAVDFVKTIQILCFANT